MKPDRQVDDADRLLAPRPPPSRRALDAESERRASRRRIAAAAAARAGGALSLTAVLLVTPAMALADPAVPSLGSAGTTDASSTAVGR